jgi:Mn2+/Fe2+ NRAMP family transporter
MAAPSALVIRFALALWVGGTLVAVLAAPVLFRGLPSRDAAGRLFDEILRRFEAVKHVLSLALVVALFVELEAAGGLAGAGVVSGIAIFLAVASNVYLAMVLRPRIGYFRAKVGSFDTAAADDPWKRKFDRLHRRSVWVLVLGWIAAAVALALRT